MNFSGNNFVETFPNKLQTTNQTIRNMDLNNNRFNFRSSQESLFGCSSQDSVSSSFLGSPTSAETQDTNYSSGYSGGGGGGDGYIDDVFDVSLLKSSSQSTTDSIISIGDGKDIDGNGNGCTTQSRNWCSEKQNLKLAS